MHLNVEIVTPEKSAWSGTADEVVLPAWEGQQGVYPEHDQLLALLRGGVCTVRNSEGERRWIVGRGFAEIGPDRVTLLTDSCDPVDGIDKAAAQKDLADAEAALAQCAAGSEAERLARITQELAQARLDA